MAINIAAAQIQTVLLKPNLEIDILRLDQVHPFISGNKWYKLQYYLQAATPFEGIVTMGGAYSNHLHACAYACKLLGKPSIGLVRGNSVCNPTLQDCLNWGMELQFIDRTSFDNYVNKNEVPQIKPNYYPIPMGGDGKLGILGAAHILQHVDLAPYEYIACPIGTGTTLHGLYKSKLQQQQLIGISAVKDDTLKQTLINEMGTQLHYWDQYSFGGFGKTSIILEEYIVSFAQQHGIVLDKVYTAKALWGLEQAFLCNELAPSKKILFVHTGGVQGNRSAEKLKYISY